MLDGFRDFALRGFWLSKPSTVTFQIAGTRTSQWFERGSLPLLLVAASGGAGNYPVWATATDRAGKRPFSVCRGCVWARTSSHPTFALRWPASRLEWRASDSIPWFHVRLERRVGGRIKTRVLGRFQRLGQARLATPPTRMGIVTLVVADSSGNLARIPLCGVY